MFRLFFLDLSFRHFFISFRIFFNLFLDSLLSFVSLYAAGVGNPL